MQENRKKVILIFPDNWISYSPTTINLSKLLSEYYPVVIITVGGESYLKETFSENDNITIEFVDREESLLYRFTKRLDLMLISFFSFFLRTKTLNKGWVRELLIGYNLQNLVNLIKFKKRLKQIYNKEDIIIGVDNVGVAAASRFKNGIHALSLEIGRNIFYYLIKWKHIKSLIIQTEERRMYLLPKRYSQITSYFVQNAPVVNEKIDKVQKTNNHRIIYMGNLAVKYNALDKIADALTYLPMEYSLVFKGPKNKLTEEYFKNNYSNLLVNSRIIFDYTYISNDDLVKYLDWFSFGVSLYNVSELPYENFNVISCPSGKLFNYYNSGLPVIGNNIIGLKSVSDFKTGILVQNLSGEDIANAIKKISLGYSIYSKNARDAAFQFDFKKNINAFFESELSIKN